jgi:hypothetical protein
VADDVTNAQMDTLCSQMVDKLQYSGVTEKFDSPFRPWLQIGDVARITGGTSPRLVGIITELVHTFGEQGFFTQFSVTSGGMISNPENPETIASKYVGKMGGTNRQRRLLDYIQDGTKTVVSDEPVGAITYQAAVSGGYTGDEQTLNANLAKVADGAIVPVGGTGGQVLGKLDETDYNTGWITGWDDLMVSILAGRLGTSKTPEFAKFKDNGSGSQGVFAYWFDATAEEELYFAVQMPHSWKGTTIKPHVHWTPKITADGTPANQTVEWGLEYTWANRGEVFANTAFVYGKTHTPADANVVAEKHYVTALSDITPSASQNTISSMLICRVFRNATDAADDTYEQDAGLLQLDFHYELDTFGSRTDTSK